VTTPLRAAVGASSPSLSSSSTCTTVSRPRTSTPDAAPDGAPAPAVEPALAPVAAEDDGD
jgi:hypothetical protein